ncbi:MAG: C4-dicarboxylate ABC transporter substrate-binding protein [Betaproteobacteria bacterium]|nr:MAG: C4-dicarboxylate ABC transporter substrate-binding protein [Betaproteobacteria bacterium]
MPRLLRVTLLSARDLLVTAGPFVLIALVLLVGAYFLLKPAPPKRVVLATGPAFSDFEAFGKRYQEELKRHGIEVVLRATEGSTANRRLLRDARHDVDFGFMRGGTSETVLAAEEAKGGLSLVSLGALFYEPVWIFYRAEAAKKLPGGKLTSLLPLRDWRVNTGARGSGPTPLLLRLLEANGIARDSVKLDRQEQGPGVAAFLDGSLDALVLVSAPEGAAVQVLLREPGIALYAFEHAEAYSRRFPYLSTVTLPRGIVDFASDSPPRDVPLVAPTTMLVARDDTHPALVQLFVQAAHRIHGEPGWFARARQFPSARESELPLAREAERYYRNGPPLLQRYLPFWLANLIDRMWVALLSIIALLIPLSRIVPPLYAFRVRSRIFRWYRVLRGIEQELADKTSPPRELMAALDRLEAKAERIRVPLSYTDELYALRTHIGLVRERLRQAM